MSSISKTFLLMTQRYAGPMRLIFVRIYYMEVDESTLLARERTSLATERNRLANERTFLAWTRTGLACVGGGLAIMRFLIFQTVTHQMMSQLVGGILVVLGIAIFGLSLFDYRRTYKKLSVHNGFAGSVGAVSAISFVLIAVSLVLLFIAFRFTG